MTPEGEKWITMALHRIDSDIAEIKECIHELPDRLDRKYVTKAEFTPIKNLAFGGVGTILIAILLFLLKVLLGINIK